MRAKHRISAEELAQKAGLTRMTVTRLEQNAANPTMETIRVLAESFGMEASELVRLAENPRMEHAQTTDFRHGELWGSQIEFDDFELYDLQAKAGARTVFDPRLHANTHEVCVALSGEIRLSVGGESIALRKGDAVRFRAMHEHTLEVIKATRFLMIHHKMD